MMVEFYYTAQHLKQHGKMFPRCLRILGRVGKFFSARAKNSSMSSTIPDALSHERENNIISSWECEGGGILIFENQGVELTSLFPPYLIPNLGKLKIFILWVKISQHIYPPGNPNAMSFAKSVLLPFCVNGMIVLGLFSLLVYPPLQPQCESTTFRTYRHTHIQQSREKGNERGKGCEAEN